MSNDDVQDVQALKSAVARLEAEVSHLARAREAEVSLARARRAQRWSLWVGALGLCLLPVLGWAAVELTVFQAGTPIVADEVNENFSALAAAVTELQDGRAGERALGSAVLDWSSSATAPLDADALIDGLEVTVETHGRPVRIEVIGSSDAQPFIGGEANGPESEFTYRVERRTEGVDLDWVNVDEMYFRSATGGATGNSLRLPPRVITTVDTPSAGSTSYRVIAWSQQGLVQPLVYVARVRLAAQELAMTMEP